MRISPLWNRRKRSRGRPEEGWWWRVAIVVVVGCWLCVQTHVVWLALSSDELDSSLLPTAKQRPPRRRRLPKIVFGGLMRNMEKGRPGYLSYYLPKLLALARNITSDLHIVVYENDSEDDTRALLQEHLGNQTFATLLLEDNVPHAHEQFLGPTSAERTARIAAARNTLLQHVEQHLAKDFDYLCIMDMDGVCGGANPDLTFDAAIFKYILLDLANEWDVLSFRFEPYWDMWAFRHAQYAPHNYWQGTPKRQRPNPNNPIHDPHYFSKVFDNVSWPDGLVEVESAFEMLALYRMSYIRQGVARYGGLDPETNQSDCEHVGFHRALRQQLGARLRLSPLVYCQGDAGYQPLPANITRWLPP